MQSQSENALQQEPDSSSSNSRTALRHRGKATMVPKAHTVEDNTLYLDSPSAYYRKSEVKESLRPGDTSHQTYSTVDQLKKAKDSNIFLKDLDSPGGNGYALSGENSRRTSEGSDEFHLRITETFQSADARDVGFENVDVQGDDDTVRLITGTKSKRTRTESIMSDPGSTRASGHKEETSCTIALQISFPFLMAGMGMVAAGLILDKVQHWEVFEKVSEVFILVPALLGLKGNLEMTLASRLSTVAHLGLLDDPRKKWSIIWGNMVLVEAQAMVVAFVASLVAMVLGWIPDGKWETNHALILCAGSLLTGAIASGILGGIMIFVIMLSRKCGVNPDNVATPIAASLGDLTTLSLLSGIAQGLYNILLDPHKVWIVWLIIAAFVLLTPLLTYIAYRNQYTRDVIQNGWFPILAAMGISSLGGFILDFAVSSNPGVAVFAPVINGVGGNFVAVQASRLSTYLHQSTYPLGSLPPSKSCDCVTPCFLYCGKGNAHARSARVMTMMVIPGQLVFLLTIQFLQAGHTTISPQFVVVYLAVSLIQVVVLLFTCHSLVHRLWRAKQDPDNCAIPYLTALGDLLGTGLLALGFLFLWAIGDRDMDVGD